MLDESKLVDLTQLASSLRLSVQAGSSGILLSQGSFILFFSNSGCKLCDVVVALSGRAFGTQGFFHPQQNFALHDPLIMCGGMHREKIARAATPGA